MTASMKTTHRMRQRGLSDFTQLCIIIALIPLAVWAVFALHSTPEANPTPPPYVPATIEAPATTKDVDTVKHDGHLFVRYQGYRHGNILHHPDCPKCQQPQVRTNGNLEARP